MSDGQLPDIDEANAALASAPKQEELPSIEEANAALGAPSKGIEDYQVNLPLIGKPSLIGMAKGLWNAATSAATLPGDVYTGRVDPLSEEGIKRSAELATFATPVSPRTAASLAPKTAPTIEELKAAARA